MGGAWSVDNPIGGLRIKPMLMSAPLLIGKAAFDLLRSGEIYNDLYVNGSEFLWGYFLAVAVAIPFGIGMSWYKKDVSCLRSFR
jgi:ABC-type nitrate/sulfonate/bicarbonate transport system permease component